MDLSLFNIFLSISAGIMSIASPCVLPVLPIILTGTEKDNKFRALLITMGLSITFISLGIISSAFGYLLMGKIYYIEKTGGIIIMIFALLILFDINIFKKLYFFSKFKIKSSGKLSGLLLGISLGLIWIPCTGPILSGILTLVASQGKLLNGIILLSFYSLGFSIPILALAYSGQFLRKKLNIIMKKAIYIRIISSIILFSFALYILIT